MLLRHRAQVRMQGSVDNQLSDIQRELGECKVKFARRVGRHIGRQIQNGIIDPKLDVRTYFKELAVSPVRLCSLYELNGVAEEHKLLALGATWQKVMGKQR